ncbi:hypothetical protein NT6N_13450 [Oceaniferula spumae]|uniref:Sulfatase N-terminal domain-containing protein n=1 Tax=Oceaniferula spumae TaxID=2979115 RepID=A0AAT9FJZ3_9BACT
MPARSIEAGNDLRQRGECVISTHTDKALGKFIKALRQIGNYENTMIIYTSDHGVAFPVAKTMAAHCRTVRNTDSARAPRI